MNLKQVAALVAIGCTVFGALWYWYPLGEVAQVAMPSTEKSAPEPTGARQAVQQAPDPIAGQKNRESPPVAAGNLIKKSEIPRTDFKDEVGRLWASHGEDLLRLYLRGTHSGSPMDTMLAFLAYDTCRQFIEPTTFAEMPGTDGARVRRAQDSRRMMQKRCAPFLSVRKEDQIRADASLRERYRSSEFPYAEGYADLPRNPNDADRAKSRQRLTEAFSSHGAVALMWNSAALSSWLENATRPESGIALNPILADGRTISLATHLAVCSIFPC